MGGVGSAVEAAAGPGNVPPASARVLIELWGPGGTLRRWMHRIGWPCLLASVGALMAAAILWNQGRGIDIWWPWAMCFLCLAIGGVVHLFTGRSIGRAAAALRDGLEMRRMAAEEIRRG